MASCKTDFLCTLYRHFLGTKVTILLFSLSIKWTRYASHNYNLNDCLAVSVLLLSLSSLARYFGLPQHGQVLLAGDFSNLCDKVSKTAVKRRKRQTMLDDYFNKKWEDFISKNTICGKLFTTKDNYCKLFM